MVLLKKIADAMEEIECKKFGLVRGFLTMMLEWKSFEKHLDVTGEMYKECFIELESREKHMCSIQESIDESLKEVELVRESLSAKRVEVEDKEREVLGYVDDLKMREEKLKEKELLIRGDLEEFENVIEGRVKEIGMQEKKFRELAYELESREEKLKQRENEVKAREEELDSALMFSKMQLNSTSELSPRACDSRRKRERPELVECNVCNNPLKRSKAVDTSDVSLAIICSDKVVRDESESEPEKTDHKGVTQVCDCPRGKFHDFDKEKEIENFDVDQIWACYDDLDGMPRLYALVEKVSFTPEFELRMVWLEADSDEEQHLADHELQVGCGRFRLGSSLDVSTDLIFSHRVQCRSDVQGCYLIYPTKGETWAVWSSELLEDHHRQLKYEIVEVLSDFVDDVGVRVSYLDKVRGVVSIFERRRHGSDSFVIPPNELRRFSHKVPSFKLTKMTNESFELDPAALPDCSDNARYNDKVKVDYEEVDDVSTFKMDRPEEFLVTKSDPDVILPIT
ncbi:hypothetical protein CQW23_23251 [Capsicum baccatum]|uniref:DUF3444 domain-containing protein n=1 Tax=Capsicum baccatum TaxID=33114 RepID=A0A2G2VRE7_CAPBA|nr:hypothetical protein CQW23_23251 [Capsicum baccatum]